MVETIGGGCKDQVAVDAVMGHARGDMASVYRLDIDDARLEAVADHIHAFWTVRMQQQLLEHGSTGLDPVAVAVMARLAPGIRAPHDA